MILTSLTSAYQAGYQLGKGYDALVTIILLMTIICTNYAEAVRAEGKGEESRLQLYAAPVKKHRLKSLASLNMAVNMKLSPPAHCEKMTYFWWKPVIPIPADGEVIGGSASVARAQ